MILDPVNDPENEDYSEFLVCRHCREAIAPETEVEWNGWDWHPDCLPLSVIEGREQAARADEMRDDDVFNRARR